MPRFDRGPMRVVGLLCVVFALGAWELPSAWAQAEPAAAERTVVFDIPAQGLASALTAFASQSGQELFYLPEMAAGKSVAGISGSMTLDQAMAALLADTGLEFERTPNDAILIGDHEALSTLRAQLKAREESRQDNSGNAAGGIGDSSVAQASPDVDAAASSPASVETVQHGGIEEIIVTGQKRAERIQDVPIAISAFSTEDLRAQKIEGGFDLLKGVPNVTFSKTNFSGYNFQIRGIGTQAISATTDPGVAVSFNNTTLIVNRLFEQEYLDIERVEVLRGPQGTLYGRNATAGVINVISAKPKFGEESGEVKLETGNFDARRVAAHYNFPMGDTVALRGAFASTVRDGYGTNEYDGSDVDDRDLWTGRLTLGWQPNDRLHANLMWERFNEDDQRVRSTKQLCHRDNGPDSVGGLDLTTFNPTTAGLFSGEITTGVLRDNLSQGCLPDSLYKQSAYGVPNGYAFPFLLAGRFPFAAGNLGFNPYRHPEYAAQVPCDVYSRANNLGFINLCQNPIVGTTQSHDLRSIYSTIQPSYQATSNIYDLSFDFEVNDGLTLSSQTVYSDDSVISTQDFNRFETAPGFFNDSSIGCAGSIAQACAPGTYVSGIYANVTPGGVFCDPQLGCSDRFLIEDLSRAKSRQFNQELRLVSHLDGAWNFSVGANYTRFSTVNDYFVFSNALTALSQLPPFHGLSRTGGTALCSNIGMEIGVELNCIYNDPQSLNELANGATPDGHNYFLSRNPYKLNSFAVFGETYWQATPALKFTAGLRVTRDRKAFTPVPSQTLLMGLDFTGYTDPSQCNAISIVDFCSLIGNTPDGRGYVAEPDIVQTWLEPTGRLGFDWKLDTGFTDETMVYAFVTRGYKAGGANPPSIATPAGTFIEKAQRAAAAKTFKPEYVNALEVGTKNTLLHGSVVVNASAFLYDYKDYQISKIVDRTAANENFDATIYGVELETIFAPTPDTALNATFGYLHTRIADGEKSLDLMDRTQGGNHFYVTTIENPNFDPAATPRPTSDYVAGLNAPADQQYLAFDDWVVIKPSFTQASNCVAPADLARSVIENTPAAGLTVDVLSGLCPSGNVLGSSYAGALVPGANLYYDAINDAPNGSAGFLADLSGNQLPNAPHFTVALGGQQTFHLPLGWDATARADWYWQDRSYARVYNTSYDRLRAWSSTNFSLWFDKQDWGLRIEAYVKNAFDKSPITGAFLNSDDTGLSTNVFTLDPRLIGVSVTKNF